MADPAQRTKETLPRGFIKILEEECKGCALCIDACPKNALKLSDGLNRRGHHYIEQKDLTACTGCGSSPRHRPATSSRDARHEESKRAHRALCDAAPATLDVTGIW